METWACKHSSARDSDACGGSGGAIRQMMGCWRVKTVTVNIYRYRRLSDTRRIVEEKGLSQTEQYSKSRIEDKNKQYYKCGKSKQTRSV